MTPRSLATIAAFLLCLAVGVLPKPVGIFLPGDEVRGSQRASEKWNFVVSERESEKVQYELKDFVRRFRFDQSFTIHRRSFLVLVCSADRQMSTPAIRWSDQLLRVSIAL